MSYTKNQDVFILENYRELKTCHVAKALNKSPQAVIHRYYKLKNLKSVKNIIEQNDENVIFIKENLMKMSDRDFANHYNCSLRFIYEFRINNRILRRQRSKNIKWSDVEVEFIRENYKTMSDEDIGEKISRTPMSIRMARYKYRLLRTREKQFAIKGNSDFFVFVKKMLKRWDGELSDGTISHRMTFIRKLQDFNPNIRFKDMSEDLVLDFKIHLKKQGLSENTINKNLAIFKVFTNNALRFGKIKKNPFTWVKLKHHRSDRTFISKDEFLKLDEFFKKGKWHGTDRGVMAMFLLSCTTGLRYSDMARLDKVTMIENDLIRIKQQKTGNEVIIPISEKAQYYLNEYDHPYCNRVVNKKLRELLPSCGISNKITFHCARHTFATLSLTIGMPIEVISKLLGHRDISTTQIYAKVINDVKIREMQKWNF